MIGITATTPRIGAPGHRHGIRPLVRLLSAEIELQSPEIAVVFEIRRYYQI